MKHAYVVSYADVEKAADRIRNVAIETPVLTSTTLNELAGDDRKLFFKVEALQKTGSFKFRGALNAIRSMLEEEEASADSSHHVVTHSSGNHAQAVALAARLSSTNRRQVKATIVMPRNTPSVKKQAVVAYGGNVIMVASTNEAREQEAERVQRAHHATFIHPSEDPRVISGQGTVCCEFVRQVRALSPDEPLQAVLIPVGGGGLASGNCIALRALLGASVKIILAEPEELDDAKRSLEAGQLLPHRPHSRVHSVADGLKTTLGPNTWPIIRDHVDDIVTVSERDILAATKLVWERLKICIEPSAGTGVAVALSDYFREKYSSIRNIGVILCGGNVDLLKTATTMSSLDL